MALNEADTIRNLEKAIECAEAWQDFTCPLRFHRPKGLDTFHEASYHLGYDNSWEKVWQDYAKAETQLIQESNNKLEEEIALWDWLTGFPGGNCSNNDIACQTCKEIEDAKVKRLHQLSRIACDAVVKHVYYGTVVRFMQIMCKDDSERTFFLCEYAQAQWRDGHFNH